MCGDRELIDEAHGRNRCNRARRLKVKRSVVCEGSIGTMKSYGGLGRARWLGEEAAAIQCLMAGVVLNFKKTLRHLSKVETAALSAALSLFRTIWERFLAWRCKNPPRACVLLPAA